MIPSWLLLCLHGEAMKSLLLSILAAFGLASGALAGDPANPILFVTQVPMPEEVNTRTIATSYMSCVSPFANHQGGTAFAGRGGSLWVRFPANANGTLNHQLFNLLAVANWSAIPGGQPAANTVAVRNPCVFWDGSKAVFSMVVGAPASGSDTTEFFWQLYEITLPNQTQLNASVKPILTKVAGQPPYNNIMPCYGPAGEFIFASDRPYNGQSHLRQREEYLGLPTVSGLWKLDPATAALTLLHHSPSGAFSPFVDSYGRLIFINWDHLSRDIEAVTDERDSDTAYGEPAPGTFSGWNKTPNGSGNFADEAAAAAFSPGVPYGTGPHLDFFPEPRNSDKKSLALEWNNTINGTTTNIFMPWMINLDGTTGEILNHVGRHEVAGGIKRNFIRSPQDNDLVDLLPNVAPGYGGLTPHNFFNNFMSVHEDPLNPGTYFGTDAGDLGTHMAGRVVKLTNAGAGVNPDTMLVNYVTAAVQGIPTVRVSMNITSPPSPFTPLSSPETIYRNPVPLKDANIVASVATGIDQTDWNRGTVTAPSTPFNFRLKSLKVSGSFYVSDVTLTPGLTITSSYFIPGQAQPVTFSGVAAWELDAAEVTTRTVPTVATSAIDPIEAACFTTANVHLPTFQNWLTANNYALSVSRDVRFRDQHDRQQPFNLRNVWSGQQITATAGTVYNIGWIQFLQGDLRRGYTMGGAAPAEGRRVVATPMHDGFSENVLTAGAPVGALRLGNDSSFAAIVPAGKALTWHLLDNDAAKTSQVKERFWVTFQRGEIRTCANCHGINTANQIGTGKPTNTPQALLDLLAQWKTNHPAGALQHVQASTSIGKSAGPALLAVARTGGSTGPCTVNFATSDGTATAASDYFSTSGTLTWADGDTALKYISVPLRNNPVIGLGKTLNVTLTSPTYASLGATIVNTTTLTETPFDAWRYTNFGANAATPGTGLPTDDPDKDGQDNQSEFLAGTIPTSPQSVLTASALMQGGQVHINFLAQPGVGYTVQYKDSLTDPTWLKLADVAAVTPGQTQSIPDPSPNGPHRFYRLVTPQAP